jgi:uroporphyrinogen-III synthase
MVVAMVAILLLTRPAAASARTKAEVARLRPGVRVIESPVMEIVPVPFALGDMVPGAVVLTSENGAAVASGLGLRPGTRAWCVGGRTTEVARAAGFDAISAEGDAEALLALILSAADEGALLHLRGEHARGDIAPRLRAAGRNAADAVVYRQEARVLTPEALTVLGGNNPVVLPLYSPRSAELIAGQGPFSAPLRVIAISRATARVAEALRPERIALVDNPDGHKMLSAILDSVAE